jgi:predicted nucleic acid-binding protein
VTDLIVDTNILIDVARHKPPGLSFLLARADTQFGISAMTEFEMLAGCRDKRELRKLESSLKRFETLKLNEPVSDLAGRLLARYSLSHGLRIADACIAATAIVHPIPLATGNIADFRYIRGLRLVRYG